MSLRLSSIVGPERIWIGEPAASGAVYQGLAPLMVSCVTSSEKSRWSVSGAASIAWWVDTE
jgi:hypothetical protein